MPVYAPDRFPFLYDEIRRGALLKDSFVLVFVANDVDAICAARVLVGLLEADHVRTTMIPVSSYTDLAAANAAHVENREEVSPTAASGTSTDRAPGPLLAE